MRVSTQCDIPAKPLILQCFSGIVTVRSRTVTQFVLNALPAITVSLRESQCFPLSSLSGLARRRYSEAHWASSLRSALEP